MKNILDQKKSQKYSKLLLDHLKIGIIKESLNVLEQKETTVDISCQMSLLCHLKKHNKKTKEISAIVESQPPHKKKIWKDKLNILDVNILTTKSLKILDQALTLKEKVLTPFWTPHSKEISEKLWLPTEIDCVDSVLNSSSESLKAPMGKSWFSIKKKHPQKKNSLMTSFQSSQFSLPDSMDSEVTQLKTKYGNPPPVALKTLKIRLFPTQEETKKLQMMFEQYRWYYNATVAIVYQHYGADKITDIKSYSNRSIRDLIRKYEYTEEEFEHLVFQSFEYKEERDETPIPPWWNRNEIHSRLPRGASDKFTSSLNSAISNYKNRNVKHFEMKFMSKKRSTDYLHFEDKQFPSFIRKIKSNYWFTNSKGRRDRISFSDITTIEKGIEIIYEKDTGRYFLHYPVDRNWFPEEDRRNESQVKFISEGDRIISLDPGVRKFLVGYDPRGESIFIGEDAHIELTELLVEIDKTTTHEIKCKLWRKVKNLVAELHWKTISFLVENYDVILLPDFRVSQMVKGKKLARITKRLLMMFSFHSFKEKLKYKCSMYNKKLIIVDESYTSCTCGRCGNRKRTKLEIYSCNKCGLIIDRDVTGSRNIFIKNSRLRCP